MGSPEGQLRQSNDLKYLKYLRNSVERINLRPIDGIEASENLALRWLFTLFTLLAYLINYTPRLRYKHEDQIHYD